MGHSSRRESARRRRLAGLALAQLTIAALCLAASVSADDGESPGRAPPANLTTACPVKLGVYLESLCPDTRRFFRTQLVPAHRLIGSILNVNLVPFGHARVLGNGKMVCQHGARECEGNRRMACVLARTKNQTELVETFGCLLTLNSSPRDCVAKNAPRLNFDELEKCTAGDESYQLMVEAEKASGRLSYVPHLTVADQSSEDIQDQAERHLKAYACRLYNGPGRPEACQRD